MTSPTLVGRASELEALRAATTAAAHGQGRIVLVGGDAGIGKTRLVTEFCDRARKDGLLTAVGGCVQLGEVAIAYAPLVEALREVARELTADTFADLAGHGRDELDGLIGGHGAAAGGGPGPLFEHLRGLLTRLGERQPVVLVLEDMHWADASTLALIAFLGRNLRDSRVVLVLTYRVDELHRRHPLRPLLTSLERDPQVERIRLTGLSRAELVELLSGIGEPSPEVDELLSRTEGNPFYVEEIVAAGAAGGALPDTLADVVLSRVGRLSEPTQELLHQAAVLGDEVDERLLAAISGEPAGVINGALREAVFEQLLVVEAAGCRFRHALIREVLYDDLLPGERERLHVAAAAAVEDPALSDRLDEHVRWAMLAHHWHAAREPGRAFAASVRAGIEAAKVGAHADAGAHFERALQLWDRVDDPVTAAGMSRAELFDLAARSVHWSSHSTRATTLAKAALDALEPDVTPETRAVQQIRLGRMYWTQLHGPAAVAAYEQAVELLAGRPASWEQAYTLAAQGQSLMLRSLARESEPMLTQAIEVATEVDAGGVAGHALCSLGAVVILLGRVDEAIELMDRAQRYSRHEGNSADVCRYYTNLCHILLLAGRFAELDALAVEGMAYAEDTGHLRHYGESITGNWIAGLYSTGRWAEADRVASRLVDRVTAEDPYLVLRWIPLLIGQGRFDQARSLVDWAVDTTAGADDIQFTALSLIRAASLARAEQRLDEARDLIASALPSLTADEQWYGLHAYSLAIGIEADRRNAPGASPGRVDELLAEARSFATGLADAKITLLPEPAADLATLEAEHARAHGTDTPDQWASVASEWEKIGQPYPAAIARYHEADAVLRARADRARAAACAAAALSVAEELGAAPFLDQVQLLIQRARLDLPAAADHEPDPLATLGLTPREADVLALLAEGLTNRQIGESLFISEKTASVHVTNLLRKLSVASRLEAAAIAQNLGLR